MYKAKVNVHILYKHPDKPGEIFSSAREKLSFDIAVNSPGQIAKRATREFNEKHKGDLVVHRVHLQDRATAILYAVKAH